MALSGISTWPNNGMILWLQEERYSQSRGALAMPDPRILSVMVNQRYCTNCSAVQCRSCLHSESCQVRSADVQERVAFAYLHAAAVDYQSMKSSFASPRLQGPQPTHGSNVVV